MGKILNPEISLQTLRVAFVTLGCKVNQYETQVMREILKKNGYVTVESDDQADIYVINTCTVTNISDRKSRQIIRRIHAQNPDARIIVTGCYAERAPDEVKNITGVVLTLSNSQKYLIGEFLNSLREKNLDLSLTPEKDPDEDIFITSFDGQTRALIKIEDGCDSFCTYCIVPYVRGKNIRSRPIESIVYEVKKLADNGYKEIVLTGVHLGAYGRNNTDNIKLHHVIQAVHQIDGIQRIRLSSIEPMDITQELINVISTLPKCAHHFHISLQSGSDKILRLMNRNYSSEEFENLVNRIRNAIPDVGLSTDIMVGFPGETEEDFTDTLNLITRVKFSRLHVFRYSPRKGTPAAEFPDHIQDIVAYRRSQKVRELGHKLTHEFCSKMLGQEARVLLEDSREGKKELLAGFTSNYARVLVDNAKNEHIGHIQKVKLLSMEDEYIIGNLV